MATEESQGEDYVIRYQKKWKDMGPTPFDSGITQSIVQAHIPMTRPHQTSSRTWWHQSSELSMVCPFSRDGQESVLYIHGIMHGKALSFEDIQERTFALL